MKEVKHISVCICTYKRPIQLGQLLFELEKQDTRGLFKYSIVVVENDRLESAKNTVLACVKNSSLRITYFVQPEQNIALTRNTAVENADGEFIAFIDDDELPAADWLYLLFVACVKYEADGVLGPVLPRFADEPPRWVIRGKFFERPRYRTGFKLDWTLTRTGNVLFKKEILNGVNPVFRPEFGMAGEDMDFFRRMMEKEHEFVWCDEAIVNELIPSNRCNLRFLLNRALLRGANFRKHPAHRIRNLVKSIIAVPAYSLCLPFLAMGGWHVFLRYLVKLVDHAGRILGFIRLNPVNGRQT